MFEEEFVFENGYDPLYQQEKELLAKKLNVKTNTFDRIELQETGIDILRAYELTELIEEWNEKNVVQSAREKYPLDCSLMVLMWHRIVEELSKMILIPVFGKILPQKIALKKHSGELISFEKIKQKNIQWRTITLFAFSNITRDEMKQLIHSEYFATTDVVQGFWLLKKFQKEYTDALHRGFYKNVSDTYVGLAEKSIKFLTEISI